MSNVIDATEQEFAFSRQDFDRVTRLIHSRAGIVLAQGKQDMVYSRLARRLRALHLRSFREYLDRLESQTGETSEWEAFTNALTTNLTSFFREEHHFTHLARRLRQAPRSGERLQIWCSAASTGEEPYSLAMTAVEAFGRFDPPVAILATDIDTQVLATGERGVYPLERIDKLSGERRRRFFLKGTGANAGYCRVVEPLRRLVSFRTLNLLDAKWPLGGRYHSIFCRNVMIYFDKPTQHAILRRIAPLLSDDGLLYAGHSESFLHAADVVTSIGQTIYRKR